MFGFHSSLLSAAAELHSTVFDKNSHVLVKLNRKSSGTYVSCRKKGYGLAFIRRTLAQIGVKFLKADDQLIADATRLDL